MLTHLSLFSGIGGLDLAAEWAGFRTVGQCEWADYPTKILEKHWPSVPKWRDIHDLSADEFIRRTGTNQITVISGGFPCQPHAVCGKRKASNDERDLWPEYRRIIFEFKPRWVVAENVPGLLTSENGRFFGRILIDLAKLGYDAIWHMFPSEVAGTVFRGGRLAIVAKADCIRRIQLDEIEKIRPDAFYLEKLEEWETRQANLLSHMVRPNSLPECRLVRNDDGLPEQVERFKCIGNSVVPQQFYMIFKAIAEIERGLHYSCCENDKRNKNDI